MMVFARTDWATDLLQEEKRENWGQNKCWIGSSDFSIAQKSYKVTPQINNSFSFVSHCVLNTVKI